MLCTSHSSMYVHDLITGSYELEKDRDIVREDPDFKLVIVSLLVCCDSRTVTHAEEK